MIPQRGRQIFADGRSARPQVRNTVARNQLHQDEYFYTGLVNGKEQDQLPFPATMQVLERGQERFNVYCTPCHSRVGNGLGMIVQRGYKPAGNFHDPKRLAEPLSHYFWVMSNGYGAMPDYSAQLTPLDRWAVAAYIRALQLSQNAKHGGCSLGHADGEPAGHCAAGRTAGELCRAMAGGGGHRRAGAAEDGRSWRARPRRRQRIAPERDGSEPEELSESRDERRSRDRTGFAWRMRRDCRKYA